MSYLPIDDHGMVGDLHTVALVGNDGAIDFMCFPAFDSPSVFASLLDAEKGGRFQIAPIGEVARRRQSYLPDSNILITRFLSHEGVAEISDFMPVEAADHAHNLVRRVKCVRGEMKIRMVCDPRFDYARAEKTVERDGDDVVFRSKGSDATAMRLRSSVELALQDGAAVAEFVLGPDQHASFVLEGLEESHSSLPDDLEGYVSQSFKDTMNFWRAWIGRSRYQGRWREAVNRSALVLKMLVSREHGSIIASPTFGLPEVVGGTRNWDYRYTWIRDASFTLYALLRLGFQEEAASFNQWIECRCRESEAKTLQIVYATDGHHRLDEEVLPNLEGYMGSAPVRIGNAAHDQVQLDIYGELMDSVYLHDRHGDPIHYDFWRLMARMVDWVCENWDQPDQSIWEVRGQQKDFLFSRVMCWVAIDRALRIARRRSLPCDVEWWTSVRDSIYQQIFTEFWSDERQAFVQARGAADLDASCLIMPLVRIIGPSDPRWLSTLRAVEQDLVEDSLVYRYRTSDGIGGTEGSFSICTFWYAECLSRSGDIQRARLVFEKMLGHANHLGLFGEQLGPTCEHLGNFPQAFTHLALISAAFDLDRRLGAREPGPV